jgi:hypothetical protein
VTDDNDRAPDRTADRRAPRVPVRHGYGLVLALIVVTYILALVATRPWTVVLMLLAMTLTALQALRTSYARPGLRLAAAVVFLFALVAAGVNVLVDDARLGGLAFLGASLLYLVTPVPVVRDIGFDRAVSYETMLGALAAYLFIGMAFAFAYHGIALVQPGPLFGEAGDGNLAQALFFSFVTMTTTGYGDIVPVGNPGQSVAVLEALLGQLFLVTAVAKVVENWRPARWRREARPSDPAREPADDQATGPH